MRERVHIAWALRVLVALVALFAVTGNADPRTEIRFFKINKKEQQSEYILIRHRQKPGCHSLRRGRKLYRVQVIGYTRCEIFAKKDCEADSVLSFKWTGRNRSRDDIDASEPQQQLLLGSSWTMHPGPMAKFKSWKCVSE